MLNEKETALILIDVQGKLAEMVYNSKNIISNIKKLVLACKALSIPIVWVEQYPAGLGETVPELSSLLKNQQAFEKHTFNALANKEIEKKVTQLKKTQWLVCGIETHICVYQTAIGLLEKGYRVELVTDAVSSRSKSSIKMAINKLQSKGAEVTDVEMCVYELIKNSKKPVFKEILPIIKM